MNDEIPLAQLEQVKTYFMARGFGEPIGRYLVRNWGPPPQPLMWDVIYFNRKKEGWCAFTGPAGKPDRLWASTGHFDTPVACYLHAELENWGRR